MGDIFFRKLPKYLNKYIFDSLVIQKRIRNSKKCSIEFSYVY